MTHLDCDDECVENDIVQPELETIGTSQMMIITRLSMLMMVETICCRLCAVNRLDLCRGLNYSARPARHGPWTRLELAIAYFCRV